jgi:hypothetical protein
MNTHGHEVLDRPVGVVERRPERLHDKLTLEAHLDHVGNGRLQGIASDCSQSSKAEGQEGLRQLRPRSKWAAEQTRDGRKEALDETPAAGASAAAAAAGAAEVLSAAGSLMLASAEGAAGAAAGTGVEGAGVAGADDSATDGAAFGAGLAF